MKPCIIQRKTHENINCLDEPPKPPKHEACSYCSTSVALAEYGSVGSQAVTMAMCTNDQVEMESVTITKLLENKCQ